jgi:DNA recombination protein RmuC
MTSMPQLQDLAIDPVSLGIGVGIGVLAVGMLFLSKNSRLARENAVLEAKLESERAALEDSFKVLAQGVLKSNTESFLTLAQERLKAAQADNAHSLDKKSFEIHKMVEPVQQHLQRMNSMVEQLQATDKTIRDDLQNLHRETSKLSGVLRNPSAQGKWGEFVLEAILEKAHLQKGTHYETQSVIEGGGRPDVIINLHDGFRIAIDSKAPINDYIARLDDDLSDDDIKGIKANMARAVRAHVKQLGSRSYQENVKGSDFVILFLPSEVVFSATLQSDPSIVDYASDNNVVIASPTLIISLLRVVGLSWRQVEMAKNAQEISALGAELHKRLSKFLEHFAKVGKGINTAISSYNDAVGSMDRSVLPAARKFKKLHSINDKAPLPEVSALESTPRQIISLADVEESVDFETDNDDKVSHG